MAVEDLPDGGVYLWMKHEDVNDLSDPSFDVEYMDMSYSLLFAWLADFFNKSYTKAILSDLYSSQNPSWSQQKQNWYKFQLVLPLNPSKFPNMLVSLLMGWHA